MPSHPRICGSRVNFKIHLPTMPTCAARGLDAKELPQSDKTPAKSSKPSQGIHAVFPLGQADPPRQDIGAAKRRRPCCTSLRWCPAASGHLPRTLGGDPEESMKLLEWLTNNALATSLAALAVASGLGWLWRACRDKRDSQKVFLSPSISHRYRMGVSYHPCNCRTY
jgi:hypothetical protein